MTVAVVLLSALLAGSLAAVAFLARRNRLLAQRWAHAVAEEPMDPETRKMWLELRDRDHARLCLTPLAPAEVEDLRILRLGLAASRVGAEVAVVRLPRT